MSVEKWRLGQPAESGQAEYKNDLLRASTAACVPDRLQLDGLPVLPRFPRLHGKPSGFLAPPPRALHGLRVADLPRANRKSSGIVRTLRTLSGLINTIEQKASGGRGQ